MRLYSQEGFFSLHTLAISDRERGVLVQWSGSHSGEPCPGDMQTEVYLGSVWIFSRSLSSVPHQPQALVDVKSSRRSRDRILSPILHPRIKDGDSFGALKKGWYWYLIGRDKTRNTQDILHQGICCPPKSEVLEWRKWVSSTEGGFLSATSSM